MPEGRGFHAAISMTHRRGWDDEVGDTDETIRRARSTRDKLAALVAELDDLVETLLTIYPQEPHRRRESGGMG